MTDKRGLPKHPNKVKNDTIKQGIKCNYRSLILQQHSRSTFNIVHNTR